MFSYICSKTGEQILSDQPKVVLYLLKEGVIKEVMAGPYNGYGSIDGDKQTLHLMEIQGDLRISVTKDGAQFAGDEWLHTKWNDIVYLHFGWDNTSAEDVR